MDNQDRETIRSKEPLTQQMDKKHSEEKEIAKNSEMIELKLKVRMKKEWGKQEEETAQKVLVYLALMSKMAKDPTAKTD